MKEEAVWAIEFNLREGLNRIHCEELSHSLLYTYRRAQSRCSAKI